MSLKDVVNTLLGSGGLILPAARFEIERLKVDHKRAVERLNQTLCETEAACGGIHIDEGQLQ
jgi:hypothetical protein